MSAAAALSEPAWRVLLLGGPSGVGKSSVGYPLARHFGVGICEIDDLHIVAKQMTTAVQQPVLHEWDTNPHAIDLPPEEILELHIAVCRTMSPCIAAVVVNHIETDTPIVLEGDYVLPELLPKLATAVSAVFLCETDEHQILRNFAKREPMAGEQAKRARVSWLFSRWLREECARYGAIVLEPRPWNTLLDRIVAATG